MTIQEVLGHFSDLLQMLTFYLGHNLMSRSLLPRFSSILILLSPAIDEERLIKRGEHEGSASYRLIDPLDSLHSLSMNSSLLKVVRKSLTKLFSRDIF